MTAKSVDATQPVSFTCTYQGYTGELTADIRCCVFTSSLVQAEIKWTDVKSVLLKTKTIKDEPKSVISLRISRQGSLAERFLGASKHYFYNFKDIVEANRALQELKAANAEANISEINQPSRSDDPSQRKKSNQTGNTLNSNPDIKASSNVTGIVFQSASRHNGIHNNDSQIPIGQRGDIGAMGHSESIGPRHREKPIEDSNYGEESPRHATVGFTASSSNAPHSVQRATIDIPPHPAPDDNGLIMSPRRSAPAGVPFALRTEKLSGTRRAAYIRRRNNTNGQANGDWRHSPTGQSNKVAEVVQSQWRLMIAFVVSALVAVVLFTTLAPRVYEPSSQEVVQCVFDGLEQVRRLRLTQQNDMFDTGASLRQGLRHHEQQHQQQQQRQQQQQQSSMRRAIPCVSPREVSDGVAELLKQYVSAQHDLVRLRVQRMQRESGDLSSVLAARHAASVAVAIASSNNDREDIRYDDNSEGHVLASPLHAQHHMQQENGEQAGIRRPGWATRVAMNLCWCRNAAWSVYVFFCGALAGTIERLLWPGGKVMSFLVHRSTILGSSSASSSMSSLSSSSSASDSGSDLASDMTTLYSEILLDGHIVSERVTVDDAVERRACLRLSRELVRLEQLLHELLLEYQDVVMAPQHEALLQRIGASAVLSRESDTSTSGKSAKRVGSDEEWISLLATGGMGVGLRPDMPAMHHTELLSAVMLRRHAIALLGMDPFSQETRLRVPDTDTWTSRRSPNHNRGHGAHLPSDEASRKAELMEIIQDFAKSTAGAAGARTLAAGPAAVLRNIAYELKYWHEHEEDWQAFVLLRLANVSVWDSDEIKRTADVPMFRGLWCFMERPIEVAVQEQKPMATPKDSSHASGKEEKKDSDAQNEKNLTNESKSDALETGDALSSLESNISAEEQYPLDNQSRIEPNAESLPHSDDAPQQQQQEQKEHLLKEEHQEEEPGNSDSEDEAVRDPANEGENKNADKDADESESESESESEADVMARRLRVVMRLSSLVHLRWMDALDLFLRSHSTYHMKAARAFSDSDGPVRPQTPESEDDNNAVSLNRRRLVKVLLWADRDYGPFIAAGIAPVSAAFVFDTKALDTRAAGDGMISAISAWLWPQLPRPLRRWLYAMQRTDPAVRRLRIDLLRVPLGEMEDVPWILLNAITVPVNVLRLQYETHQAFRVACGSLIIVLAIFLALVLVPF